MILIGEKINCTRKEIAQTYETKDAEKIASIAKAQAEAGADFIDVNSGIAGQDEAVMSWLIDIVQEAVDTPIAIDTSHTGALACALDKIKKPPLINSISAEKERYDAFLPVIEGRDCSVVALCMSDDGTPQGVDDRLKTTEFLVKKLNDAQIKTEDIFVDPCVLPASSAPGSGKMLIDAIRRIKESFPGIHVTGGLSNVSYGLPKRKLLNRNFIAMCIAAGMDSAIVNPNDAGLLTAILAAEALIGADDYCMNYVTAEREGRLA